MLLISYFQKSCSYIATWSMKYISRHIPLQPAAKRSNHNASPIPHPKKTQPYFGTVPALYLLLPITANTHHTTEESNNNPVATHVMTRNLFPRSALTPTSPPYLLIVLAPFTATAVAIALAIPNVTNAIQSAMTFKIALNLPARNILPMAASIAIPINPMAMQ